MKPRVGVSACLLGEKVRYDGAGKRQPWAGSELAERVNWVPVCPEVELGLGVPREPIQLEPAGGGIALVSIQTRRDLTQAMRGWAAARVGQLAAAGLDGYVFKARSPSCGLGSTPVLGRSDTRDGLFAETIRARFPTLPVADEEALAGTGGRGRFLRLASAHCDLRALFQPEWTRGAVVDFHTRRKLLLMAHSPGHYARLGTLVGRIAQHRPAEFAREYVAAFLAALREDPAPGRHANALAHAAGYFSQALAPEDRAALVAAIGRIGAGELSKLEDVKARIFHYAGRHTCDYLLRQVYLAPCKSR